MGLLIDQSDCKDQAIAPFHGPAYGVGMKKQLITLDILKARAGVSVQMLKSALRCHFGKDIKL